MVMQRQRVVFADDHACIRRATVEWIERSGGFEVVGEVGTAGGGASRGAGAVAASLALASDCGTAGVLSGGCCARARWGRHSAAAATRVKSARRGAKTEFRLRIRIVISPRRNQAEPDAHADLLDVSRRDADAQRWLQEGARAVRNLVHDAHADIALRR